MTYDGWKTFKQKIPVVKARVLYELKIKVKMNKGPFHVQWIFSIR